MHLSSIPRRLVPSLFLGLLLTSCGGGGGGPSDAGTDAGPCGVDCGANSICVETSTGASCGCVPGFSEVDGACVANVCPEACGANAYCDSNATCYCQTGFSGDPLSGCTAAVAANACQPHNPCLNGGTCTVTPSGHSCACVGGATGTNCETPPGGSCGTYTDIVYAVTARFAIRDTPGGIGDETFAGLTTNATSPAFENNTNTTPFTRSTPDPTPAFTRGFVRLRFGNDQTGKPVAGTVRLVEYYVPLEFTQTKGATVVANTDHSVGILESGLTNCGGGDAACTNHTPSLSARMCQPNASGVLVGRTLTWDACAPGASGEKTWSYVMARTNSGAGCATSYNGYGNTFSSSALVPTSGKGDSYQTWNQALEGLVFSGTDPMTATFRMPEMQIPNGTGISTTWLSITASSILAIDCGTTLGADLVCDQE